MAFYARGRAAVSPGIERVVRSVRAIAAPPRSPLKPSLRSGISRGTTLQAGAGRDRNGRREADRADPVEEGDTMKKNRPSAAYLSAVVAGLIAGSSFAGSALAQDKTAPSNTPPPRRRTRTPVAAPTAAAARRPATRRPVPRPPTSTPARGRTPARARAAARPTRTPARDTTTARVWAAAPPTGRPTPCRPRSLPDDSEAGGPGRTTAGTAPWKHGEEDTLGQSLEPARSRLRHRPSDGPLRRHPRPPSRRSTSTRRSRRTSSTRAGGRSTSSIGSPSGRRSSSTACR